jgi:uncharacterized membrane protein
VTRRQLIALLAVVGGCISIYLTLYKLGKIGTLSCSIGSCETVNTSKWSQFLGVPVAEWGLGYYLVLLAVAIAGTTARLEDSRVVCRALLGLATAGVLFSAYLTSLELLVIHAICIWCVGSAIVVTAIFVLALIDYRAAPLAATPSARPA